MRILVTGSSGLIGSEVIAYFASDGHQMHGIDNNMRADFFGPQGDTRWNQKRLLERFPNFQHHEVDIRDRTAVLKHMEDLRPDLIVHAAAQHSHDLAASRPLGMCRQVLKSDSFRFAFLCAFLSYPILI